VHRDELATIEVANEHFQAWWSYFGLLAETTDLNPSTGEPMITRLYGFETETQRSERYAVISTSGTSFGFVVAGSVSYWDEFQDFGPITLGEGQYFASPGEVELRLAPDTRVVVSQRVGFKGLRCFGGPIESAGRLRYVDRCSDTVLISPPRSGDACLNYLHFPQGVEQTRHTHPSTRSGVVARGIGWCETPHGISNLRQGVIFHIPRDGEHRFATSYEELDIIAYHPDSDWGPTDDDHPMINRTWVDGSKIDNSAGVHLRAEFIDGRNF
jgi:quercetin dioxygenase-like cupin family protein